MRAGISEGYGRGPAILGSRWSRWRVLFCCFDDFIVEQIQSSTQHDPLDTILIALAKGLPYRLFLRTLASDADSRPTTVWPWRVLLNLAKLDSLGGYIMTSISEVEHAPEEGIGVWFGDLEERKIRRVR